MPLYSVNVSFSGDIEVWVVAADREAAEEAAEDCANDFDNPDSITCRAEEISWLPSHGDRHERLFVDGKWTTVGEWIETPDSALSESLRAARYRHRVERAGQLRLLSPV